MNETENICNNITKKNSEESNNSVPSSDEIDTLRFYLLDKLDHYQKLLDKVEDDYYLYNLYTQDEFKKICTQYNDICKNIEKHVKDMVLWSLRFFGVEDYLKEKDISEISEDEKKEIESMYGEYKTKLIKAYTEARKYAATLDEKIKI